MKTKTEKNKLPQSIWHDGELTICFKWYETQDLGTVSPFNQVYGVCFNSDGEILIQRKKDGAVWCLPGGTVEAGETPEETLARELVEETDVTIKNPIMLGGQSVKFIDCHNPDPTKGDEFYQLRYFCEVDEILPQTPDPDDGETRERKFVRPEEITKYFDWKDPGKAIFAQAVKIFNDLH